MNYCPAPVRRRRLEGNRAGKSHSRIDKTPRSAPIRGIMASSQRVWWPKLILGPREHDIF
jgi:hypothetical protein